MLRVTFHTSLQRNVRYSHYKPISCLFCALSPPFPRRPKGQGSHLEHPSPSSTVQPPPKGGELQLHGRQPCWRRVWDEESPPWHVWVELITYTEPKRMHVPLQKPCASP